MKLKINTTSETIWWGIYGLVKKNGWEDIDIYDEHGNFIYRIHLYAKSYLRAGLRFLKDDVQQLDYAIAIEHYLKDNQYYYWYYYDEKGDEDIYEVEYDAPRNKEGIKPKAIEIWCPEEGIGMSTILSSVKEFSKKFLKLENSEVEFYQIKTIEAAIESYKVNQAESLKKIPIKINLSTEQIYELSKLWNKSKDDVYKKIHKLL